MEPTPERLRRVSARLFAKQGLAGTSMREIARETGITQAAIYHHYQGKEELYLDAVRTLHREKLHPENSYRSTIFWLVHQRSAELWHI